MNSQPDKREITTAFIKALYDSYTENDIAVTGLAGIYPQAENTRAFWQNLVQGKDCITEIPAARWNWQEHYHPARLTDGKSYCKWGGFLAEINAFDPLFFNIAPGEAAGMDPQERIFLQIAYHALEDAGITRQKTAREHGIGVFAGVMNPGYAYLAGALSGRGMQTKAQTAFWSISNRVSYFFDLHGPSITVDTACSSSLTVIHLACASLLRGECKAALAGGVNLIMHPSYYIQRCSMNMLSQKGRCRAFGDAADGFVPGEGAGAVVLKPLLKAIADQDPVYAVIKATGINAGGKTSGYTVPNPAAQAGLVAGTIARAGFNAGTITCIEAHGTGTALGDPVEIAGLTSAFRQTAAGSQFCAIGSVKSCIGHLEAAAGIAGLTKVILQMKHKTLVKTLYADPVNRELDFSATPFRLQHITEPWQRMIMTENGSAKMMPRRAGISAFGAGGANAHVIVEEFVGIPAPDRPAAETADQDRLFLFSAGNALSLTRTAGNFLEFLKDKSRITEKVSRELAQILARILCIPQQEITAATPLSDFGLDKLSWNRLAWEINCHFDTRFIPEDLVNIRQTGELTELTAQACRGNTGYSIKPDPPLDDIAYTLQTGRNHLEERLAIVAAGSEDLCDKLAAFLNRETDPASGKYHCTDNKLGKEPAGSLLLDHFDEDTTRELFAILFKKGQLEKAAGLWVCGLNPDWQAIADTNAKLVHLPLYPFLKEIYTIEQSVSGESIPAKPEPVPAMAENEDPAAHPLRFFKLDWEKYRLPAAGKSPAPGALLIFNTESSKQLTPCLADNRAHQTVTVITLAQHTEKLTHNSWNLQYNNDNDYSDVLRQMQPVQTIYFLGCFALQQPGIADIDALALNLEYGVLALFRLSKALQKCPRQTPQLTILANYLSAGNGESVTNPYAGAVAGFVHSLALEFPACHPVLVECDPALFKSNTGNYLRQVLDAAPAAACRLRIKNNSCFIPAAGEASLTWRRAVQFRSRGVYWIAGGHKGIGLTLAFYLAVHYQARLALTGRSPLNPGIEKQLALLHSQGAEAVYLQADLSDEKQVVNTIKQIKKQWQVMHGVIHSAAAWNDKTIANLTLEDFLVPFKSKATGSVLLGKHLQQESLEFLIFFSSIQSLASNYGQANYAAACTFQDTYASCLLQQVAYPVLVINWGYWGSVGAGAHAEQRANFREMGIFSIEPGEGMPALARALSADYAQLVILKADRQGLQNLKITAAGQAADKEEVRAPDQDPANTAGTVWDKISDPVLERKITFKREALQALLLEFLAGFIPALLTGKNCSYAALASAERNARDRKYLTTVMRILLHTGALTLEGDNIALVPGLENQRRLDTIRSGENRLSFMERGFPGFAGLAAVHKLLLAVYRERLEQEPAITAGNKGEEIRAWLKTYLECPFILEMEWKELLSSYLNHAGFFPQDRDTLKIMDFGDHISPAGKVLLELDVMRKRKKEYFYCESTAWLSSLQDLVYPGAYRGIDLYRIKRSRENLEAMKVYGDIDAAIIHMDWLDEAQVKELIALAAEIIIPQGTILLCNTIYYEFFSLLVNLYDDHFPSAGIAPVFLSRFPDTGRLYKETDLQPVFNYGNNMLALMHTSQIRITTTEGNSKSLPGRDKILQVTEITAELKNFLSRVLGVAAENFDPDTKLDAYGMDSISMTKTLMQLKTRYLDNITAQDIIQHNTIRSLSGFLAGRITEKAAEKSSGTSLPGIFPVPAAYPVSSLPGIAAERITIETPAGREYEIFQVGAGQPVVFLAGLAFTWKIWQHQCRVLAPGYRLIFPHLPGHGGSHFNGKPFTFEDLAADLVHIFDTLQLPKVNLAGWCIAGNIAQLFAYRFRERLNSLVLICTTHADARTRGFIEGDLDNYAVDPSPDYRIELGNCLKDDPQQAQKKESYISFIQESSCVVEKEAVLYYIENLYNFNSHAYLKELKVPALVIAGTYDIAFPPHLVTMLAKEMPDVRYYECKHSGHLPFLTEADDFNRILMNFLEERCP